MNRIMIVGGPGSGKSTLARWLGMQTDLPVFHMDHIHWKPGWIERDASTKKHLVSGIEEQSKWILEGGLSATYANRIARADLVIWLDLPVVLRLWRVTKRTVRHLGRSRPDLPVGCNERLNGEIIAFYRFIWQSRHTSRAKIVDAMSTLSEAQQFRHLQTPADVRAFQRQFTA